VNQRLNLAEQKRLNLAERYSMVVSLILALINSGERWNLTAETWLKIGSFGINKKFKGSIYGIIQVHCLIIAWMS
jgi:hypothetical protein